MQRTTVQPTPTRPQSAPKQLTVTKETLRRLTGPELRLTAGGRRYPPPRTGICTY